MGGVPPEKKNERLEAEDETENDLDEVDDDGWVHVRKVPFAHEGRSETCRAAGCFGLKVLQGKAQIYF
jgi:hypothetical protein